MLGHKANTRSAVSRKSMPTAETRIPCQSWLAGSFSFCGILNEASLGPIPRQQLFDDSLIKSCKRHLEGAWSRQNNAPPPNVHILIPRAYKYVTLYGKRDFTDVIKLKTLRWGDYLGLSGWI